MEKIAIIDFGGQYTHLIARRIRELGVFSQIYLPEVFKIKKDIKGIIFSGGPQSVDKEDAYKIDLDLELLEIPLLGICYGHQLIASMQNGKIEAGKTEEYGFTKIFTDDNTYLYTGLQKEQVVWMSHKDFVKEVGKDYIVTAHSENIPVVSFRHKNKHIYGLQFHPEVTHTENGMKILDNFLDICNVKREWNSLFYEKEILKNIRKKAKDKKLLILLSGGVDSLVAFESCIRAVGKERVFAIHVDTGFMRKNESYQIISHLNKIGYENLQLIDAKDMFFNSLDNVIEPEKKRSIVGKLFVEIVHNHLKNLDKENWLLVQGTIYPDTIESGSTKNSAKIKTHHNRVPEIQDMIDKGLVLEPLKELYKDEVRKLGIKLGLPYNLVDRQPFPGPGLVIRIICSNGFIEENFDKEKDKLKQIIPDKLEYKILPVKSVGVQGDFRTYRLPIALKYKDESKFNWKELRKLSSKILNNAKTINRVVYSFEDMEGIVLKKHFLTKENIKELQDIDFYIRQNTKDLSDIWQMPVVSLPLKKSGKPFYLIRPVLSIDAMSADFYRMEIDRVFKMNKDLKNKFGIAGLFYDITTKPPATIEWE